MDNGNGDDDNDIHQAFFYEEEKIFVCLFVCINLKINTVPLLLASRCQHQEVKQCI